MRQELIDFLIRNNIDVTEDNINMLEEDGIHSSSIDSILSIESRFDSKTINKIYNYVVKEMSKNVSVRDSLESRFTSISEDIVERFDYLNRSIAQAYEEIKSAQTLEKNMSGHVKTISLDFSDPALINENNTTTTISDGVIIGCSENISAADKDAIRLKHYPKSSVSSNVRYSGNIVSAKIEKINDMGIGILPMPTDILINNESSFRLLAETDLPGEKEIELIIDKEDSEYFNQIEIRLDKAHLASFYTSEDNIEYTKITSRPKYIKNTIIPIKGTNSRYVKIVFHKNRYDYMLAGSYGYQVTINELSILQTTFNDVAIFETNEISIDGNFSSLSLDTCCTFSNPKSNIDYKISIDDGPWEYVRPVDKHKVSEVMHPIALPINGYTDNKLISLTDFVDNKSSVDIPEEFLLSNDIRVFSGDITGTSAEWDTDERYYTVYGLALGPKEIDLGSTSLEINGKWATGNVTLSKGLYKIRAYSENYANLFNPLNATLVSESSGEYVIKDSEGNTRSISDPLYPYNHKMIVESSFDYLFSRELIEKDGYTLYNNQNGYKIATTESHNEVIIVYKLHVSNASSLKLRAELSSIDKTTIPYIEKAIIRLA